MVMNKLSDVAINKLCIIIVVFFTVILPGIAQTLDMGKRGIPVNGVVLLATLQKNIIAPGEDVNLVLRLRNEGRQRLSYLAAWPTAVFTISVQDENNHLIQPKPRIGDPGGSCLMARLWPNEESATQYPLSGIYDLNKIGLYRITAMRKITDTNKNEIDVVSNTVILKVTDRISHYCSIAVEASQISSVLGAPIDLKLNLQQTTVNSLPIIFNGKTCGYKLQVQNNKGDLLQIKPHIAMNSLPIVQLSLTPGQLIACTLRLSELYYMGKTGHYFVTAIREGQTIDGKSVDIYSPTVMITVTTPMGKRDN